MTPRAIAATPMRSVEKLERALSRPSPALLLSVPPSSRSGPRRTLWKNSSPVREE